MIHLSNFLRTNPIFKRYEVDGVLFYAYDCPIEGSPFDYWVDQDYFCYIIKGGARWKTAKGEYIGKAGEAVYLRKGAHRVFKILTGEFCALLIFTPHAFVQSAMAEDLQKSICKSSSSASDSVIPIQVNSLLQDCFTTILQYFSRPKPPVSSLLKLKLKEIIIHIFTGEDNLLLADYFLNQVLVDKIPLGPIMEENFNFNLCLSDFARLSNRSLATFKRDFQKTYHTTPGKWIKERRLKHSRFLVEHSDLSINEIAMESGFENTSHFIRVFKQRFGITPSRLQKENLAH